MRPPCMRRNRAFRACFPACGPGIGIRNRNVPGIFISVGVLPKERGASDPVSEAHSGREWIARVKDHVEYTAALHAVGGAVCASGVDIALIVAVIAGIGVNQAADGAVLLRDLGLDAAPTAAVACDDDLAFDVDALFLIACRNRRGRRNLRRPAGQSRPRRRNRR